MACLDTTMLLDLSGRSGGRVRHLAHRKVEELNGAGETLVTTRFSVAELSVGIYRSRDPLTERAKVVAILLPLGILEFDQRAAEVFGRVVGRLEDAGVAIGDMDALIASVCLVTQHSIVTRNVAHYSRVPDLVVETY